MKIIIAGAGALGFHLAKLLSREDQDITLIDTNEEVITHVGSHLDVMTIRGDAASIEVLEQANVEKAHLFIAVTTSEKTNLLVTILAKQFGAKKTIARIDNPEYFEESQKERFKQLGVDVLISPHLLAAQEIERLLRRASFTDLYEFEHGQMSVVGFTLDTNCRFTNHTIAQVETLNSSFNFRGIALLRNHKTIIPKPETVLRKGDHLYMVTHNKFLDAAMDFVGKELKSIKNVMIIGGTSLALRTAQLIEDKYNVTIVLSDKE
ncbi:MAG: NAD-binding protein, partial [Sinomicrobium sp.]|nr:NAD-binding protein [Sinomicrobium sp.]